MSFDGATLGDVSTYEYAIDFGNLTRDYNGKDLVDADAPADSDGIDDPGLYRVTNWNNDIYFDGPGGNSTGDGKNSSSPFAMEEGSRVLDQGNGPNELKFLINDSDTINNQVSYYRAYGFDISALALNDISQLDVHWTMSCGNDAVDGQVALVPEPSLPGLLLSGLLGLFGSLSLRRSRLSRR